MYVCMLQGAYLTPIFHLNLTKPVRTQCEMKRVGPKWPRGKRTPMRFNYAPAKRSDPFGYFSSFSHAPDPFFRGRFLAARPPGGGGGGSFSPCVPLLLIPFFLGGSCFVRHREKKIMMMMMMMNMNMKKKHKNQKQQQKMNNQKPNKSKMKTKKKEHKK